MPFLHNHWNLPRTNCETFKKEESCLINCFVSSVPCTQCGRHFLFPDQENVYVLAHSMGIFMVVAAHRIIFHSPCSRLAPGIELLLLKHDSLQHLYFPLHSILRLGNPALLLFIVGHKWKAENFRVECNTLKTCTIYRYKVHLKTREKPQTDAWLNSIARYPKMTCLGAQHGPKYRENGIIITAHICECWVHETCCHVLNEIRTTCWDDDGVQALQRAFKNRSAHQSSNGWGRVTNPEAHQGWDVNRQTIQYVYTNYIILTKKIHHGIIKMPKCHQWPVPHGSGWAGGACTCVVLESLESVAAWWPGHSSNEAPAPPNL